LSLVFASLPKIIIVDIRGGFPDCSETKKNPVKKVGNTLHSPRQKFFFTKTTKR